MWPGLASVRGVRRFGSASGTEKKWASRPSRIERPLLIAMQPTSRRSVLRPFRGVPSARTRDGDSPVSRGAAPSAKARAGVRAGLGSCVELGRDEPVQDAIAFDGRVAAGEVGHARLGDLDLRL